MVETILLSDETTEPPLNREEACGRVVDRWNSHVHGISPDPPRIGRMKTADAPG